MFFYKFIKLKFYKKKKEKRLNINRDSEPDEHQM